MAHEGNPVQLVQQALQEELVWQALEVPPELQDAQV
jgi:hypothetical protein